MDKLLSNISIQVNEKVYLKNPESSDLGKKIITGSIQLIDKMGFECFTFRKLGKHIKSPEASVYRYFESKHKLLLYLTSWYWAWMEYKLVFALANIPSAKERLKRAIRLLTEEVKEDGDFEHINEISLNRIVIAESSKAYLTKEVDVENKEGLFMGYKKIVARISELILELNNKYKYPNMLTSTIIEGAHHQHFFAEHLPRLTDVSKNKQSITDFYIEMVFRAIDKNK